MTKPSDLVPCPCVIYNGKVMARAVVDVHLDPAAMASISRGIDDMLAGRMVPFSELRRKYEPEALKERQR